MIFDKEVESKNIKGRKRFNLNTMKMGKTMKKSLLTLAVASALSVSAQAEQFWADNSLSVLQGDSYTNAFSGQDEEFTTMTLEHVSGHSWGGVFLFVDRHNGDVTETYAEVSPKFTLSSFEGGFVKAVNASFTYESGSSQFANFDNYLYGVGLDLNIPGLNFASATAYRAFNDGSGTDNDDNQITLTYGFSTGNFNIDGYVDYSFDNDSSEDQLAINPQITYNIGPMLGISNKVKLGIEYFYWDNKIGQTEDQNSVSLLLKTHL